MLPFPPHLQTLIQEKRKRDIAYLLLTDEEVMKEIEAEQTPASTTQVGTRKDSPEIQEWQQFYEEVFGRNEDFSKIILPPPRQWFNWTLIMAEGLTPNILFDKATERMKTWKYTNNLNTITSVRKTDKAYAILMRDRVEADQEHKNKSAKQIEKEGINGITLEERILLELWYHWKTRKHLDKDTWTLCTSSRRSDGCVPLVYWYSDDSFRVHWCGVDYALDRVRVREIVSCP